MMFPENAVTFTPPSFSLLSTWKSLTHFKGPPQILPPKKTFFHPIGKANTSPCSLPTDFHLLNHL